MREFPFYNRIRESEKIKAQPQLMVGLWLVNQESDLLINGQPVKNGGFLLPDTENKAFIIDAYGDRDVVDPFSFEQFPKEIERESILIIARHLNDLEKSGATWIDWVEIPPLVAGIPGKAKLTVLEKMLGLHGQHLSEIAHRPQQQLKIEIERMPVGRARRIPARAQEYLSHHTEDWEYPKFSSVVPRRILSTIPDDLLDFYENRLWARLVTGIHQKLLTRIDQLKKLQLMEFQQSLGITRRQNRIYSLYEKAVSDKNFKIIIDDNLITLGGLLQQAFSWIDAQLYKSIPPRSRTRVPSTVRITNILNNDRHYRYVNLLWREYLNDKPEKAKTNLQVQQELQELCFGFDRYCFLIVCRAMQQLGYTPSAKISIQRGCNILLQRNSGNVELNWQEDGIIQVVIEQNKILKFVPVVVPLTDTPVVEQIISKLDYLESLAGNESVVFLYPGSALEREVLPTDLQQRVNGPGNDTLHPGKVGFIPVSPYDLVSTERVGRSLRWTIFGNQYISYPPKIKLPFSYQEQILKKATWLNLTDKKGLSNLLRLPKNSELRSWSEYLRSVLGDLGKQPDVNRQHINLLEEFKNNLELGFAALRRYSSCPLCDHESGIENFRQTNDNFTCTCNDCNVTWGTQVCGNCHERYPFLQFNKFAEQSLPSQFTPTWAEDNFGMDILAVPCQANPSHYICPCCGNCEHLERHSDNDCMSCRGLLRIERENIK